MLDGESPIDELVAEEELDERKENDGKIRGLRW